MKLRITGQIVCGCFCIIFMLLALIYVRQPAEDHILRSVVFAILSVTTALGVRYFEY